MLETVADALCARAADGDRPGLRCQDEVWSWAEVAAECGRRAAWMSARRSDRPLHVGVLLDNVPEFVFLIGGAALSGSVIVALNTTRTVDELIADVSRTDCDVIVTEARHVETAARLGIPIAESTLDEPVEPSANEPVEPERLVTPDTLLMLIFTSGTSGEPRAVRITHRKLMIPGESLASRLLTGDDVVYCPMPLFHSGALMAAFAPALASGAQLVLRRRFSASGTLADIRRHGCTYFQYVGKALSYVLATPPGADDRDNPLRIAFGNEAAPLEQRGFAERFGCVVIDGYGSTETAITFSPDPHGPPGALGRLTDGIRIIDPETGRECPPARLDDEGQVTNDAVGELVNTKGRGLFDGYYGEPAPSSSSYHSGDFAYADENGYVFFVGRSLDRLRVDGENFGAAQVERALAAALEGVERLAVYRVPDAASGDQVMAALVVTSTFRSESLNTLVGVMNPKWVPRYVRIARDLPLTASNKILKRRLAAEAWHTDDPIWWRPGRDLTYRPMTPDDLARLRTEFELSGRATAWPVDLRSHSGFQPR